MIQVNEDGFTMWSDATGIIIVDAPFERLENDHGLCIFLLRYLHDELHKKNE